MSVELKYEVEDSEVEATEKAVYKTLDQLGLKYISPLRMTKVVETDGGMKMVTVIKINVFPKEI